MNTTPLDIYVFYSTDFGNVRLGVEHGIWAARKPKLESQCKQYITKAGNLPVGAHGVSYVSDYDAFTVPFIVTSRPSSRCTVTSPWKGEFILPFHICPLGNVYSDRPGERYASLSKREATKVLPTLSTSRWADVIKPHRFVPSRLTVGDWEELVQHLVARPRGTASQFAGGNG